jgi:cell division septation protein DedD
MSDERDETRPFVPSPGDDDATRVDGFPSAGDETRVGRPGDTTQAGGIPGAADETRLSRPADETRVGRPGDETAVDPMRPTDDWAPSRANPAWSGRAEVRAPQPATYREVEDWPGTMGREPRDRWWMPIVVGIVAVVLLGALAFGIYLIVQNSDGAETPAATTPPSVAPRVTTASTPSTTPSTEPTTDEPSPTPSTTDPATTEVTIPALKGLSLQEAEAALTKVKLRWRVLSRDDEAFPGTVIDSDPAEGQEVPPDTRVTLVAAQGATTTPTTGSTDGPGVDDD